MKKLFTLILSFILLSAVAHAQRVPAIKSVHKDVQSVINHSRNNHPGNSQQALWDVQFSYNLTPANVVSCVYTGTEFWIGRYTTDTLYTMDTTGVITSTFVVTGVGTGTNGIRGMTYDGTFIYATVGTNKVIYNITPTTKTLVSSQ